MNAALQARQSARNGMIEGNQTSVLAFLMTESGACDKLLHRISPAIFLPPHSKIVEAIFDLYDEREKINLITVSDRLHEKSALAECGGRPGITAIATATTSQEIAESALDCITDNYRERMAAKIGERLHKGAIGFEQAIEELSKLNRRVESEKSWNDALNAAVVTSSELHNLELVPRKKLLGDWFCEGDLGFVFAFRGVGKTWLALAIAQALSTGGKLGDWQALAPVKVLYVDGEMPPDLMRARCEGLQASNANLEFLNHEILFDRTARTLNIASREVQQAITGRCVTSRAKVLFLDNLSTLASGMKKMKPTHGSS